MKALEQSHSLVMLLVPWQRLIFGQLFLFQISNDVKTARYPTRRWRGTLSAGRFGICHNAGRKQHGDAVAKDVTPRRHRKIFELY